MKKLLLSFVIFLISHCVLAQQAITGKINFQQILNYKGTFSDTLAAELDFNQNKSLYVYDRNTRKLPKDGIVNNAAGMAIRSVFKGRQTDSIGQVVYADFVSKTLITRENFQGQNFIVPDSVPHINWKIGTEHKIIAKQNCKKAIGDFRGRTYVVWYAEEIPAGYGPWKLSGLPGLILEARSTDEEVVFLAENIIIPAISGLAVKPPVKGDQLDNFKAYHQLQDKKVAQYAKFLQSNASSEPGTSVVVTPQINRLEKTL